MSRVPVACNYLVASVLSYPGKFFDPDTTVKKAEHIALAVVHSAPMFAFSPDFVVHQNLIGARTSCIDVSRMAWAWKLRLVLRVPEVRVSLARVASARVAGLCLVPRHPGWRSDNIISTLERSDRFILGSRAELRNGTRLQRRISVHLQADGGWIDSAVFSHVVPHACTEGPFPLAGSLWLLTDFVCYFIERARRSPWGPCGSLSTRCRRAVDLGRGRRRVHLGASRLGETISVTSARFLHQFPMLGDIGFVQNGLLAETCRRY